MKRIYFIGMLFLITSCSDYYRYEPEQAAMKFCRCFEKNRSLGDKIAFDTCTKAIMDQYYYFKYAQEAMTIKTYNELNPLTADSAKTFYVRFNDYLLTECKAYK